MSYIYCETEDCNKVSIISAHWKDQSYYDTHYFCEDCFDKIPTDKIQVDSWKYSGILESDQIFCEWKDGCKGIASGWEYSRRKSGGKCQQRHFFCRDCAPLKYRLRSNDPIISLLSYNVKAN